MAIALEFIDFVVPRKTIEEKYPGGWPTCMEDHRNVMGGRVWYDDHLFRDGAMSPGDIGLIADKWTELGFVGKEKIDGVVCWKDFCVVESMFGGPTLPCAWIEVDLETMTACLSGAHPGDICGPVGRE